MVKNARKKIIHIVEPPDGLFYIPQFLTAQQEQEILHHVSSQTFEPYDHHGYKANREVIYFGTPGGYGVGGAETIPEPIPDWLVPMIPVKQLRYSITFRTIRNKQVDLKDRRHAPESIAKRLSDLQLQSCPISTKQDQSTQLTLSL